MLRLVCRPACRAIMRTMTVISRKAAAIPHHIEIMGSAHYVNSAA